MERRNMATQFTTPAKNKMYGLLHEPGTDRAIVREVRSLKVGIGQPAGHDIHAYIANSGKWKITVADKVAAECTTKEEARAAYNRMKDAAPERNYPKRLQYF